MKNERLTYLFNRYLEQKLSDDEEIELMKEISGISDEQRESLIDEFYDKLPQTHRLEKREAERIFYSIVSDSTKLRKKIFLRRTVTIAASVIIALTTIYFTSDYFIQKHKEYLVSQDINPGGEKAILTLSDGSVVELSDAKDSVLVDRKNDVTIKLEDNKLVFKNDQKAKSREIKYSTLTTPRRGEYKMELPDGTNVWLNAESSIKFPEVFDHKERRVFITGEVYFEVIKLADDRPFIVELIDKAKIEVLGTHFNVNAYDNEGSIRTTLLEGSIKVESSITKTSNIISPGQQATITSDGLLSVSNVDTDEIASWKNGRFMFGKADIQTIMRQLERWYDVQVTYDGNVSSHFGGAISRKVSISRIFEMLEMTNEVKFKLKDSIVTVLGK